MCFKHSREGRVQVPLGRVLGGCGVDGWEGGFGVMGRERAMWRQLLRVVRWEKVREEGAGVRDVKG